MMAKAKKTTTKASTAAAKPAAPAIQKRETLRITDTTLRDAHQSLWATRLRTNDIMDIIDVMDNAGFYSLECWGGATFDVCMRFLRENPWERLRQIKAHAKNTPLQMLIRGQNILGYRNYADDLLERFIALAAQNGIDIFRTFDALNDNRNIEKSIKFIKRYGAHAQGTICYTISPVHTIEKYVEIAREQEQMGVDSICIKDMAGILSPLVAKNLVSALTKAVKVPIQIHSHATSGMAVPAYLEGVLAGAGAIDCAVSSMAGFSSQPPVETMLSIFEETQFNANIDRDAIRKINAHFLKLRPTREPNHSMPSIIDPEILVFQSVAASVNKIPFSVFNMLHVFDLVLGVSEKQKSDAHGNHAGVLNNSFPKIFKRAFRIENNAHRHLKYQHYQKSGYNIRYEKNYRIDSDVYYFFHDVISLHIFCVERSRLTFDRLHHLCESLFGYDDMSAYVLVKLVVGIGLVFASLKFADKLADYSFSL